MPHVTIEYSANVGDAHDIGALVDGTHEAALGTGMAALAALRTRAVRRDHFRVADGDSNHAFIAIHARVGPGRTKDQKQSFIEVVLAGAQAALGDTVLNVAWSIEITVLDAELRINDNDVRRALEDD